MYIARHYRSHENSVFMNEESIFGLRSKRSSPYFFREMIHGARSQRKCVTCDRKIFHGFDKNPIKIQVGDAQGIFNAGNPRLLFLEVIAHHSTSCNGVKSTECTGSMSERNSMDQVIHFAFACVSEWKTGKFYFLFKKIVLYYDSRVIVFV